MVKKLSRNLRRSRYRSIYGSTLPEVIAVLLIISILLAIAIPSFLSIISEVKCKFSYGSFDYTKSSLQLTIESPSQEVSQVETISGKMLGCVPVGKSLYFSVYVPRKREFQYYYFPIKFNRLHWNAPVRFGESMDNGLDFSGSVVLTDPNDPQWDDRDSDNGVSSLIGKRVSMLASFSRM
jgi:hypothetical protein